jgi:hypothetical protein
MPSDCLKITYEDAKDRRVDEALARQAEVRRTGFEPRRVVLFSGVRRTWVLFAAACIATAVLGWGMVAGIAWLASPKDTPIQIGNSTYVLSRDAQQYLRIAEISPYHGRTAVLIIEEPHYSPTGQFALYKGLEIFFREHPQLVQKTAFLAEGVPAGQTLSIEPLVRVNRHPDDDLIATVLSSFLIPGYVAYEWKQQDGIPIFGIEDEHLYRLSAKLWLETRARDTPEASPLWHLSVVARNKAIARSLIDKVGPYENPILFVGGLHLDHQPPEDFSKAREDLRTSLLGAEAIDPGSFENVGIRDYLERQQISYTFLSARPDTAASPSEDTDIERYARVFAAQQAGNYREYINSFLQSRPQRGVTVAPAPEAAAQLVANLSNGKNQSEDEGEGGQNGNEGEDGEKGNGKGSQPPEAGNGQPGDEKGGNENEPKFTDEQQKVIDAAKNRGDEPIPREEAQERLDQATKANRDAPRQLVVEDHQFDSGNNSAPGHWGPGGKYEGKNGHITIHNVHIPVD